MKDIRYDPREDILYINTGGKVQESVPRGGFVIDLSSQGKVVGIEVLDASDTLSKLLDRERKDTREMLSNIEEADVVNKDIQGVAFMILKITSVKDGERTETKLPLEVPEAVEA